MRLKLEWRTPEWRLGSGADFRGLSRHDWIIKGWSLDKMFTCLGKPSMFTLASWSFHPFMPTRRPTSIKLKSLAVLLCSLFTSWNSMVLLALYPSWSPMLHLDSVANSDSEKSLGLYLGTSLITARFFPVLMKDQTLLWSISLCQWFTSLPTILLHAPGIRCPREPPDVVIFLRFLC